MKIANRTQIMALEKKAGEVLGVSENYFIEQAGEAIALLAAGCISHGNASSAAIFAGKGNNGADGFAAALSLLKKGCRTYVITVGYEEGCSEQTGLMMEKYREAGGTVLDIETNLERAMSILSARNCDVVIDAILGIGVNSARVPDKTLRAAISLMNCFERTVISVDIPSGMNPDTGKTWDVFVHPDRTITFTLPKPAHHLSASQELCGALDIVDIGIPRNLIDEADIPLTTLETLDLGSSLFPRKPNSHKGDYGKLAMFVGSVGHTGAAALAARAALRVGAGTVSVFVPARVYEIVASKLDEAMVFPLPSDSAGRFSVDALPEMLERLESCSALLMGCGIGRGGDIEKIVPEVIKSAKVPLILDADGLNALSMNINILKEEHSEMVLTPHMGEFKRLFGENYALEGENDPEAAMRLAKEYGCVIAMKGHRTITADERRAVLNLSGNAGMAKGGSGDVLAGIIASFAAQGMLPRTAAVCGVGLHGRAGDLAAESLGQYSMLPSDIIDFIPQILKTADRRKHV